MYNGYNPPPAGAASNAYYNYCAGNNFNTTQSQTQLRDFEVISKLGEGSFSQVFQVKRKSDEQIYAMKKVKMGLLKEKEKENALNEVRILASLNDEYIVGYKEAFIDEPSQLLCVVMEYASGGDLQAKINGHKKAKTWFPEEEVWKALIHMSKGLQTLHEMKILHRDLKCANVFLYADGAYKLGDMNVSKVAKKGLVYTQTGTPYYASPEVWRDQPYDTKSDIWSLGCVLYEMCSLQPPFRANDMEGLYKKVQKGAFERIPAKYSNDLQTVLASFLKVSPIQRPTCDQILNNPIVVKQLQQQQNSGQSNQQANGTPGPNKKLVKKASKQELLQTILLPKNLGMLKGKLPKANYKKAESIDDIEHDYEENEQKQVFQQEMKKTNRIVSAGAKRIEGISQNGIKDNISRYGYGNNPSNQAGNISSNNTNIRGIRPPSAQNKPGVQSPQQNVPQVAQYPDQNKIYQDNNNNTNIDQGKPRGKIVQQRPASGVVSQASNYNNNYNDYGRNNGLNNQNSNAGVVNTRQQQQQQQQPVSAYKVNPLPPPPSSLQPPVVKSRPTTSSHPIQQPSSYNPVGVQNQPKPKIDGPSNYYSDQPIANTPTIIGSKNINNNINPSNNYNNNPYRPVVDRYEMTPSSVQNKPLPNRIQSSNINTPGASRNIQTPQQYIMHQNQQDLYNKYNNVVQGSNNVHNINNNVELTNKLAVKERALLGGGGGNAVGGVSQSVNVNPLGNYNNRQQQQQYPVGGQVVPNGISRMYSEQSGIGIMKQQQQRIQSSRPYEQQQLQQQQQQQQYPYKAPIVGYSNIPSQQLPPAGNIVKSYDPANYAYAARRNAPSQQNRYGQQQVQQPNYIQQPQQQQSYQPQPQVGRPNWWG